MQAEPGGHLRHLAAGQPGVVSGGCCGGDTHCNAARANPDLSLILVATSVDVAAALTALTALTHLCCKPLQDAVGMPVPGPVDWQQLSILTGCGNCPSTVAAHSSCQRFCRGWRC